MKCTYEHLVEPVAVTWLSVVSVETNGGAQWRACRCKPPEGNTRTAMKSVCFVNPSYYANTVGGAEVQLYLMATGIASLGRYKVSYLTTDVEESMSSGQIHIVRISDGGGDGRCSFEEFCRALDSVSADLIVQLGRKQFTWYSARYCSIRDIPFLFSAASDIDCRSFREVPRFFGEFPLRRLANPTRLARAFVTDRRTLAAMKSAHTLLAQTRTQQRMLEELCNREVEIFQNLHHVPPGQSIVKDKPPIVLWLASLKPVKRPWLFLEICKRLRGSGARVVMAGRMNDERFRQNIDELVQSGDLEYIEHVTFEQSNELISRATVFVLTSRHEGLPNTLIQAWLRRTPTVSLGFDPDGMIARNGIGVHTTGVGQAVDAILDLLREKDKYYRVANKAREFAIGNFGMDSQVQRLNQYIDRALSIERGDVGRETDVQSLRSK